MTRRQYCSLSVIKRILEHILFTVSFSVQNRIQSPAWCDVLEDWAGSLPLKLKTGYCLLTGDYHRVGLGTRFWINRIRLINIATPNSLYGTRSETTDELFSTIFISRSVCGTWKSNDNSVRPLELVSCRRFCMQSSGQQTSIPEILFMGMDAWDLDPALFLTINGILGGALDLPIPRLQNRHPGPSCRHTGMLVRLSDSLFLFKS